MIELQFLNYLLDTKDSSVIVLNNIDKKFFSEYKDEWLFIENHFKLYNCIPDKETFLQTFPNFELIKVNEPIQYLLEELFKNYQERQLALTFNKVREELINGNTDKAVDLYKNAYETISTTGVALQSVDILKDTSRYDAYVERINDFGKYYVKTGFKELDNIIGGWDREEELATIAAKTNQGKSWLLLKFAVSAAEQGLNVGIYSGEMSERKVGYRIDTLIQHISNGQLIHGNPNVEADYKRYIETLPTRFKGSIKVLTPKMISGPATVSALRTFIDKDKLDILFIDQHSLLEDERGAKNPVERASNISRDLKNLQVIKRIPIISVSQQNRSSSDNVVAETDKISQSDRIAQDSTIILFFERKKDDPDFLTIHLVKSRDSENNKKLTYKVNFNLGTFEYIPEGDEQVENQYNSDEEANNSYTTEYNDESEVF